MKLYKVYLKIDKDKVHKEGRYSFDEMMKTLDIMATKCELSKDSDGWYVGTGESANAFVMALLNAKWFLDNCQEWLFWNLNKNIMEDALAIYKDRTRES